MKLKTYILLLLSVFLTLKAYGQAIKQLDVVSRQDSHENKQAVLYGNFVQRLGFSSGGFPQDIRIMNIGTNEIFSFRVKPSFKSAKENAFCFYIKPGTYKILNYWWTQSKWYGGKMFTENIYKGIEASKVTDQSKKGQIQQNNLEQYSFVIADNSVFYLGSWHFDKELVSFSNEKEEFDKVIQAEYPNINFKQAKVEIPK